MLFTPYSLNLTFINTNYRVFVGSENDVLDRYYQASRVYPSDYIIRVTADCPVFDGGLLDEAIKSMSSDDDYLGMISETFADGLDIEIFNSLVSV